MILINIIYIINLESFHTYLSRGRSGLCEKQHFILHPYGVIDLILLIERGFGIDIFESRKRKLRSNLNYVDAHINLYIYSIKDEGRWKDGLCTDRKPFLCKKKLESKRKKIEKLFELSR